MERKEITEKTQAIVRHIIRANEFQWNDLLTAEEIGGWDSLTHMLIISDIEDVFKVKFKLRELNGLNNLGDLITLIQNKIQPS